MILNENISKHQIERTYSVARKTQREWVRKYQAEGISGLVSIITKLIVAVRLLNT